MKRNITKALAAAMLTAMAACQDGTVLVDDTVIDQFEIRQPEKTPAIEFATFADRSTRATATISDLEYYHQTFKVYATKTSHGGSKLQTVFEGVTVTANIGEGEEAPNTWEYDTDRYWDKQADNYQFVAFSPAHAPLAYQHNLVEVNHETAGFFSVDDFVILGQNLQEGAPALAEKNVGFNCTEGSDCDVMRSAPFTVTDPKTTPVVTLNFRHTLAKLLVTAKANAAAPYVITIDSITVEDLLSTGVYDNANGWESKGEATVDYSFTSPSTALSATEKKYFIEVLAIPQAIADTQVVTLNYTITSGDYSEEFTYTTNLAALFAGKATNFLAANSYTINFNIAPEKNIITFDTGVEEWTENGAIAEIYED